MNRRRFLAGLAAASALPATLSPAVADAVGVPGMPELVDALLDAAAVTEGFGGATVHVVFSIRCPYSRALHAAARRHLREARFRWIPVSLGTPDGDAEVSALLARPTPAELATTLRSGPPSPLPEPSQAARRQSAIVEERLKPLLFAATQRPIGTPTLVTAVGWRVRVVRGAVRPATLAEIVNQAIPS